MGALRLDRGLQTLRRYLPSSCIVCGLSANRDYCLCAECEQGLPRCEKCCYRCGLARGTADEGGPCNACLLSPPGFDSCCAAFRYAAPIDKLVANFKFSARFDVGNSLARILASAFNAHYGDSARPQLLLPVPLHRSRLRARGFNQAEQICRVLARYCRVSTSTALLHKTRNTEAQTAMKSAAARAVNQRGAFSLHGLQSAQSVTHIALVDDVVTTMATSDTIARLLKSQLSCRIDLWCLARAQR